MSTTPLPPQADHSINEPPAPVPAPTLEALDPGEAVCGDIEDITMHVYGAGFTEQSVITFNGGDEPTDYVNATKLTTVVKPSTAETPGEYPVTVRNSDGQESAPINFEFKDAETIGRHKAARDDKPKHRRGW